jgi:cell division transport system permease protein
MSRTLRAMGFGLRRAAAGLGRRPGATALAVGAMATSLLLVALLVLCARNVAAATASWGGGVQMIVYLDDTATADRAAAIADALRTSPAIERIDYIPSAAAESRLRESLGAHAELLDGVEAGMFPGSLEIALVPGVRDVAAIHPLIERLGETAGVESVELLDDWVGKLAAVLTAVRLAALLIGIVAALACIYVAQSSLRLALQARRQEHAVARALGASAAFVRGPLLVEGALLGGLGALLAAALLWIVFRAGAVAIEQALAAAFGSFQVTFLPTRDLALLLGAGAVLGGVGGTLAGGSAGGQASGWVSG